MALENVKIVTKPKMEVAAKTPVEYQHDLFDFSAAEVICMDFTELDKDSNKILTLMKQRSNLIIIDTIKDSDLTDAQIYDNESKSNYKGMPCMMQTNTGSLIPQMIVPALNSGMGDNGLYDASLEQPQASDKERAVTWTPDFDYLTSQGGSGDDAKSINSFGSRKTDGAPQGYITMETCLKRSLDNQGFLTRRFTTNLSTSMGGGGFCFGYQFLCDRDMHDTTFTVAPKINLFFGEKEKDVYNISISIPPNNDIHVRVKEDAESGTLNTGVNKIQPPHCTNNKKWNLLYCFPLHAGMVLSGNATKSLKDINDSIFVKISEQKGALNCIDIFKNTSRFAEDTYIDTDIKRFPEQTIKWVPTAIHNTNGGSNINLAIPEKDRNNNVLPKVPKFGNSFTVEWVKSFGKFFYCPIFFFNKCRFRLYFKGDLMVSNSSTGEVAGQGSSRVYHYLPIGKVNIVSTVEEASDWSGINSQGGFNNITGEWVGNVLDENEEPKESVYCCKFNFVSETPQRSPIELFGVAAYNKLNGFQYKDISTENGTFVFNETKNSSFTNLSTTAGGIFPYIQSVSLSSGLGGISGNIDYDRYALSSISNPLIPQCIGELDFNIQMGNTASTSTIGNFSGIAMENRNNYSENNHTGSINLIGVQKKLEDIKLISAPFWDGDPLAFICKYLQSYSGVPLLMVNTNCSSINSAVPISVGETEWTSTARLSSSNQNNYFRVPRSTEWQKPAVDFKTGTSVLQALNHLAEVCGCVFVVQPNGKGYFFELTALGYPGYVDKQSSVVEFLQKDVVSINLSPYLEDKYNTFMTMGFLSKINIATGKMSVQDVTPSIIYTKYERSGYTDFPWSRILARTENGWMTEAELAEVHSNTIKGAKADIYQGTITVKGNNLVDHIYQKITVCGVSFFVTGIDHNVDLSTKSWTTSYNVSYYTPATGG